MCEAFVNVALTDVVLQTGLHVYRPSCHEVDQTR
jgi:hypothetical protein